MTAPLAWRPMRPVSTVTSLSPIRKVSVFGVLSSAAYGSSGAPAAAQRTGRRRPFGATTRGHGWTPADLAAPMRGARARIAQLDLMAISVVRVEERRRGG